MILARPATVIVGIFTLFAAAAVAALLQPEP